jgi:hypothetical protein
MAFFFVSSPMIKKHFPSFVSVIRKDFSGAALDDTEVGAITVTASGGFCLVANIKKDNNRNATSHIAVMSMLVLLRGIFALPIINYLCFRFNTT